MDKKALWLIGIVAVVLVAIYLLSSTRDNESGEGALAEVRVGTFSKALGNSPFHVALAKDWFEQHPALEGIDVVYTEYNDRPSIAAAFNQGDLDLVFSAEIPAILIRAQGENVKVALVSGYALQEVLVPQGASTQSVEELRGKSIAVQAGTSSHFGLVSILDAAGLSTDDVRLAFMPAAEGRSAFERGDLDAWAVWAPWVETQEVSGRGRVIPGSESRIYSVGTIRSSFASKHPAYTSALIDVVADSKRWIQSNTDEAIDIVSAELGFERAVVAQAWPKFNWGAELDDVAIIEFQNKAVFLSEQELTRDNIVVDVQNDLIFNPVATDE